MGQTRFCCKVMLCLDLQGSDPNVMHDTSSQYVKHFCEIDFKSDFKKRRLWAGHDFAARSCCDIDLQGSNPNVVRDTSSQFVDHFCEIDFKSDFKKGSYGPDTILLQGHAVTLTFKVGTQMFCATHHLNMVIISVKKF